MIPYARALKAPKFREHGTPPPEGVVVWTMCWCGNWVPAGQKCDNLFYGGPHDER